MSPEGRGQKWGDVGEGVRRRESGCRRCGSERHFIDSDIVEEIARRSATAVPWKAIIRHARAVPRHRCNNHLRTLTELLLSNFPSTVHSTCLQTPIVVWSDGHFQRLSSVMDHGGSGRLRRRSWKEEGSRSKRVGILITPSMGTAAWAGFWRPSLPFIWPWKTLVWPGTTA